MKEDKSETRYLVPAVDQASQILFCLASHDSTHMSLNEICKKVGIHKSKAYSILCTFQKYGIVRRNEAGKGYALGLSLISLSRKVLDDFDILKYSGPLLEELSKNTGGTVTLGLIAENRVTVVAKYEFSAEIGITIRTGRSFPITYGSHGKAIAAFLPEDKLDNILKEEHLYFHGKCDEVDLKRLEKELAQCRIDGYALDLGEVTPGLNSIAAPVIGLNSYPIGYVALLGLFDAEKAKEYGPLVAEAGEKISRLAAGTD
ncbi:MAG: IclR family transcriptional regulator [Spirochaetes bacterium]|nr:IclR family transcriptional regulator [Spirochaetota bacterium]